MTPEDKMFWKDFCGYTRKEFGCLPIQGEPTASLFYALIQKVKDLETRVQELEQDIDDDFKRRCLIRHTRKEESE